MEPDARYTLVGLAVIILAAVILGAVFWLSRAGEGENADYYTIYFKNQSLSGLQVDSNVTMKGIQVGSVKSLKILPTDIERVRVVIRVQATTPVKTDTKAIIQRNLLTGLAFIDLADSTQGAPPLTDFPPSEDFPVIPEGESGFQQIQSAVPSLVETINLVVARMAVFFSVDNETAVEHILSNLKIFSDRLADKEIDIGGSVEEIRKLAIELRTLAVNLNAQLGGLAESYSFLARNVANQSTETAQSLQTLSGKLSTAAEGFENPRSILWGPPAEALGPGEGGPVATMAGPEGK